VTLGLERARLAVASSWSPTRGKFKKRCDKALHSLPTLGGDMYSQKPSLRIPFIPSLSPAYPLQGGRIWVGSGNLTYTGWGGNQEVATAWPIGPGAEDILACSDPKWPDLKQK